MSKDSNSQALADPAPVFSALGDATRLKLVSRLGDGRPQSISELTKGLSITRQGVTKHLRILSEAGIIESILKGRENRFVFKPKTLIQVRDYLTDVSEQWDRAIARLKDFVEEEKEN